jgi:CubicO group peptidase (beta-lactamase class C family)
MNSLRLLAAFAAIVSLAAAAPKLPGVADAVQTAIDAHEVSGAVTAVVTKDKLLDLEAIGFADIAASKPMQPDSIFCIKSMTKPVTGVAVMMLQDEGKLNVEDPVAKYIPEFADLKTPSGKPANLTLAHLLTHTSGLGEGLGESGSRSDPAHTLADLVRQALASPMQFEPGTRWKYTQSGINTAGRIVEIVTGLSYDQFLQQRLFDPLGMRDTTFYPTDKQAPRIVTLYTKDKETGNLEPVARRADFNSHDRPPLATSGIYSTAPDFARLCQMLLNGGELDGKRYLKPETIRLFATPRTGDLKAGFVPGSVWGLGCGIVAEPQGVTEALSPGTFGHGGAYGTQMWIDSVKGVGYVLMIQREKFGTPGYRNGDDTTIRHDFQLAAANAVTKRQP